MTEANKIGIDAIACVLGDASVDNFTHAEKFGFDPSFLTDKIGFTALRKQSGENRTFELSRRALVALAEQTGVSLDTVDCLIVCTQNPDGHGLPNTASALHGEMGLSQDCAAFDISLGCSGYVYGLSVIRAFMAENDLTCGVLITADPYSKIIDPEDRDTAVLFGDGASATLLRPGAAWQVGRSVFGSDGTRRDAIAVQSDGRLKMNGRGVFVFSAQTVPPAIQQALDKNKLGVSDVDLFLMHQGSKYIVTELGKRLGVDADKMPFAAAETGNLVSSSLPVLLAPELSRPNGHILIAGFGVGLSWGVSVLTRNT
ncbi:ketoacyl-ACP synthase III [Paracoccus jiaweipingae]|uniref:ketoacyl-ACP synthase III n=1 Tax=unclassified Paracoccus (in: a-proteobacteria) TaxID=2688777 RepID=UPI0037A7C7EB